MEGERIYLHSPFLAVAVVGSALPPVPGLTSIAIVLTSGIILWRISSRSRHQLASQEADARDIAAGPIEARGNAGNDWIGANDKHDRDCGRRSFRDARATSAGDNDFDISADKILCQSRQPVTMAFCPAILDRKVASLNVAGIVQPGAERRRLRVCRSRARRR